MPKKSRISIYLNTQPGRLADSVPDRWTRPSIHGIEAASLLYQAGRAIGITFPCYYREGVIPHQFNNELLAQAARHFLAVERSDVQHHRAWPSEICIFTLVPQIVFDVAECTDVLLLADMLYNYE